MDIEARLSNSTSLADGSIRAASGGADPCAASPAAVRSGKEARISRGSRRSAGRGVSSKICEALAAIRPKTWIVSQHELPKARERACWRQYGGNPRPEAGRPNTYSAPNSALPRKRD